MTEKKKIKEKLDKLKKTSDLECIERETEVDNEVV